MTLVFEISNLKWRIDRRTAKTRAAILLMCLPALCGCSDFFRNQSAPLGGDQAGGRGTLRVLFINNTPQRAVFTYGTYDQGDPGFQPDFEQFGPLVSDLNLDGDSSSAIRSVSCGRVFAIGSDGLRALIAENVDATVIDEALVDGVAFFDVTADGNAGNRVGAAEPL